ncbi:MAG: amino acid ABC transporter ATP-binding protein [Rothia sp. (in: high G+C Gram-positive bacteria)]|uniref:amino acid ABC transporter ATP-binding protein n=1 Tax=Rothia sp. (in: high G+C Gram-positive bacteria) TaxID=1885016 RepID=UPI0026E0F3F8|nr:amino acid ABC transporter ATP-binding protein [Rothia sp. (in: high G+C Gram-positive bacteria)]MDO5750480.1 amino acid ABC transporter ATP-binding protein [Rothia sp. (in: high G+C Gram-positive bacteria)]
MLKLDSLHKSFGDTQVLKDISLEIADGETTVILGPSGSGKSTLLRCFNLLERPEQGVLSIENDSVDFSSKLSEDAIRTLRQHSAMVFQQFNLFPHYTAAQNVALAPVLNGKLSKAQAAQKAQELLAKVGLADKTDSYPDNLSGGQQQRVAIARALAVEPDYLLFDEPTSALDPELEAEVIRVLMDLAAENRSLVIVTHNMAFAQKVADRIIFLEGGSVRYNGAPAGFFASDDTRIRQFLNVYELTEYHI